jgi:hypothetical protein
MERPGPRRRSRLHNSGGRVMGRGLILWLLGVPIPILLLMWALGWLS